MRRVPSPPAADALGGPVGFAAVALLVACGGTYGSAPDAQITVSPRAVVVAPGATTRFEATIAGTSDPDVRWSADGGTIDQQGVWTAPGTNGTYRITARSAADPAKRATASAAVSSPPVRVWVEPERVTLVAGGPAFRFRASVTGAEDTAVSWSIRPPEGGSTIDATGMFVAPFEGTFRVIATSLADPGTVGFAEVTVVPDLLDHGGAVMARTRTFALWWGDPTMFPSDALAAVEALLDGLDGSRYLGVADQYMRGAAVTTSFGGSLFDASVPPSAPTPPDVRDAACRAIAANGIAPQPGDTVFVHTSNFPSDYVKWCNWHSSTTCDGRTILVAYSPNPAGTFCEAWNDPCLTGYSLPTLSLLSGAAHEFMEAITNPFGDGWHSSGKEIADKCGQLACVALPTGIVPLGDLYSNELHGCSVGE